MFNNSSKMLFLMMMITGTLITGSSYSWLAAWMGLEINLWSFIPLVSDNKNFKSTEASLKYFLTQALASTVLLFAVIILMLNNNINNMINESFISSIMLSTLLCSISCLNSQLNSMINMNKCFVINNLTKSCSINAYFLFKF